MKDILIVSSEDKLRAIIAESVTTALNNYEKPEKFISRKEAASRRGICLPTLDRAIERGEIQVVRVGKRILIKDS